MEAHCKLLMIRCVVSFSILNTLNIFTFHKLLTDMQADPVGNTPREMAEVLRQETERWGKVIREGKITVQ